MEPSCKVIFYRKKRYCIVENKFSGIEDVFLIPEIKIFIDKLSYNVYKKAENKAFIAMPKTMSGKPLLFGKKRLYALYPINKDVNPRKLKILYNESEIKGEGTYGKVEFFPSQKVVVKHSKTDDKGVPFDIVKEIAIYRLFKHFSCLPELYDFDPRVLKLELSLGIGTLAEAIPNMNEEQKKVIAFRMIKCLRLTASQGIIHCDLKPQNSIISSEGKVQIIDWGLAEIDHGKYQLRKKDASKQTLFYRSPELLDSDVEERYSNKVDIFSMGLIFIEIFTNKIAVTEDDDIRQAKAYLHNFLNIDDNLLKDRYAIKDVLKASIADKTRHYFRIGKNLERMFPSLTDGNLIHLISRMLEFNPDNRPTFDEIIMYPFFKDIQTDEIVAPISLITPLHRVSEQEFNAKYLTGINRQNLFYWLRDIFLDRKKHSLDSLCLAFTLIDQYLVITNSVAKEENLKAVAIVCFGLATKLYDTTVFGVENQEVACENLYSEKHLLLLEMDILRKLNGNILIPSAYSKFIRNKPKSELEADENSPKRKEIMDEFVRSYLSPKIYSRIIPSK